MKAQRRHELQQNSLVRGARNFPELWRDYGSKIALGIILVALAVLLVRMWINKRTESRQQLAGDLTSAREQLETLRQDREQTFLPPDPRIPPELRQQFQMQMQPIPVPAAQVAEQRRRVWKSVNDSANNVLQNSSEPVQQAEAKLLRADVNYYFALLADIGLASNSNKDRGIDNPPEQYLATAATNYQDVIGQSANVHPEQLSAARLGMAAVHECRREFAPARALYETVQRDGPTELLRLQATNRLGLLAGMKPDLVVSTKMLTLPSAEDDSAAATTTRSSTAPASGPATSSASIVSATTTPATAPMSRSSTMPATAP